MENLTLKLVEEKLSSLPKDLNELILNKFKEVEALKDINEKLGKDLDEASRRYKTSEEVLGHIRIELKKLQDLKLRAEDLDTRERNLEIDKLKHEIELQKQTRQEIHGLVAMLVKNPRAIELIKTSKTIPVYEGLSGGGGYHTDKSGYENSTKETKEVKDDNDLYKSE